MMSFFRDDRGTIEMPMRFVVYVILTGAIVAIAITGLSNLEAGMASDSLEKQIGTMKVSLETMQSGAARDLIDPSSPEGSIRTYELFIPHDLAYVAFGADPDPDNDGNLSDSGDGVLTDRGNFIIYNSGAGKKKIPLYGNIELREGALEDGRWVMNNEGGKQFGVVLRGIGKSEITFELVYDPVLKERYTLAHFTDDVDAAINPYDPEVLPNGLRVRVDPDRIPADGTTSADVIVQLIDAMGREASKDGVEVNLSVSGGTLGSVKVTTVNGRARTNVTSDTPGTAVITADSPGLNPGSSFLTVKRVPIVLYFGRWLYDEDEKVSAFFSTDQSLDYGVIFRGNSTGVSIPFVGTWWPNARIEIDGNFTGEETIADGTIHEKAFPSTRIGPGVHVLNVTLTNDTYIPLVGDTNLFLESVTLSE